MLLPCITTIAIMAARWMWTQFVAPAISDAELLCGLRLINSNSPVLTQKILPQRSTPNHP